MSLKERIGEEEYARRVKLAKRRIKAKRLRDEQRTRERMIVEQFNADHPDGCERCGEPFDAEGPAEVVAGDGTHLIVHVSCMEGDPIA